MVWLVAAQSGPADQQWIVVSVQSTQIAAVGVAGERAKERPDVIFAVFAQVAVVRARIEVDVIGEVAT